MTVLILFLLLFLFMFIGVPIAISLGLSGALTILLFSPDSVRSLAIKLFETSEAYTLLAIPFFLLSGAFMTTSTPRISAQIAAMRCSSSLPGAR